MDNKSKLTEEQFYQRLQNCEEGKQYLQIVNRAKKERPGISRETGYERHHIHPKGLGGLNQDNDNIVKLTVFEHCILHAILARVFEGLYGALRPISTLGKAQYTKLSLEEQAYLQEHYAWKDLYDKALHLPHDSHRKPVKPRKRGYVWIHTETQQTRVLKENLQEYLDKGFVMGKLPMREEVRAKLKGRVPWNIGKPWSEEQRAKFREQRKHQRVRLGTTTSLEARQKFSDLQKDRWKTPEYRAKMLKARHERLVEPCQDRVALHKEGVEIRVKKESPELERKLQEGWLLGGRPRIRKKK